MLLISNHLFRSKRVTTEPVANSPVSARTNIFEQDVVDEEAVKEDSERMDAMMRQLMGGNDDDDDEGEEVEGKLFFCYLHRKKYINI